ncbi:MAG: hypothetical protein V1835_01780, partial [Candidatus Micrarchaeota archaeon]
MKKNYLIFGTILFIFLINNTHSITTCNYLNTTDISISGQRGTQIPLDFFVNFTCGESVDRSYLVNYTCENANVQSPIYANFISEIKCLANTPLTSMLKFSCSYLIADAEQHYVGSGYKIAIFPSNLPCSFGGINYIGLLISPIQPPP